MSQDLQCTCEILTNVCQKNSWEIWVSVVLQILTIIVAFFALLFTYYANKRNDYLPYIAKLHEELNDIILSLYDLFDNPQWKANANEGWKENYKNQHDDFLKGHRYFIVSSIMRDQESIKCEVNHSSRRKVYFNELRKQYVLIYEALLDATKKSKASASLSNYFELTEYEKIYKSYKNMTDIE